MEMKNWGIQSQLKIQLHLPLFSSLTIYLLQLENVVESNSFFFFFAYGHLTYCIRSITSTNKQAFRTPDEGIKCVYSRPRQLSSKDDNPIVGHPWSQGTAYQEFKRSRCSTLGLMKMIFSIQA